MPWLASEPRKEKPAGLLMSQAENVMGIPRLGAPTRPAGP